MSRPNVTERACLYGGRALANVVSMCGCVLVVCVSRRLAFGWFCLLLFFHFISFHLFCVWLRFVSPSFSTHAHTRTHTTICSATNNSIYVSRFGKVGFAHDSRDGPFRRQNWPRPSTLPPAQTRALRVSMAQLSFQFDLFALHLVSVDV